MIVDERHVFQRLMIVIDKWFRKMLKWQMHTNLFRNPVMDDITGTSLLDLVHMESVKKLMTDLFLLIYQQEKVEILIQDFLRDTISDYLKTEHCLNNFTTIVVQNALRNDYVLKGLFTNLASYLRQDS